MKTRVVTVLVGDMPIAVKSFSDMENEDDE